MKKWTAALLVVCLVIMLMPITAKGTSAPVITLQPEDMTVGVREEAVFKVKAEGEELTYQWQSWNSTTGEWEDCNGFTVQEPELHITRYDVMRNRLRCVVTDQNGNSTISDEAIMTVVSNVVISYQPYAESSYMPGETVELYVGAEGGNLRYRWQYQRSDDCIWLDADVEGAGTDTITLTTNGDESGYNYRCIVSNEFGSFAICDPESVKVEGGFALEGYPSDWYAAQGQVVTMNVSVTPTSGVTYQWQESTDGGVTWKDVTAEGADTKSLSITTTKDHHNRRYRCIVTSAKGVTLVSEDGAIYLTSILGANSGTIAEPEDQVVRAGREAIFYMVLGKTDLTYQWQYRQGPEGTWMDLDIPTSQENVLVVEAMPERDGQQFRCIATDPEGHVTSTDEATLTVICPQVIAHPGDTVLAPGESVEFHVEALGTGLSYQWQYRDTAIDDWTDLDNQTQTITVEATDDMNGAQYRCVVTDSKGITAASYEATIQLKSQSLPVVAEGTCGAGVYWELDENGTIRLFGEGTLDFYPGDWTHYSEETKALVVEDGVCGRLPTFWLSMNMTSAQIGKGITVIGQSCFERNESLAEVVLSDALKEMEDFAFRNCVSLVQVNLPNALEIIGKGVFAECTGLEQITIPSSVQMIGEDAFENCTALTEITFRGNAPEAENIFTGVTATAYYPAGNATWTEEVMTAMGGDITWVSYIPTVPMYRLYNPNSGEHFYTGSIEEREILVTAGWHYEGVSWNAPIIGGTPVHRVYNPNSGDHHYTTDQDEVDMLVGVGWQYEGVAWNSAAEDNIPLYRLWNPNADCGSHHYTSSTEERDMLTEIGWILEGIGWYGMLK